MGAAFCILLVVLFIFFVVGRGPAKTAAQVTVAGSKSAQATAQAAKAVAAATPAVTAKAAGVSTIAAQRSAEIGVRTAKKAKSGVVVGATVGKATVSQTGSVVKAGLRSFRQNYRAELEARKS